MQEAVRRLERVERTVGALALATAGAAASTFLLAATLRLLWPYEIEWLESELLQHAARVAAGQPLYQAPSLEFAPTIYPPLFAWLSGGLVQLVGVRMLAPRLVSVAATLVAAWLVARAAARMGGSLRGAGFAAALLLAAYVPCGTVLDLARLDALWVALLLAGTSLADGARGAGRGALAGLVLGLATATKQPAALFAVVLAAVLYSGARPAGLALAAAWAGVTAAVYGGLHVASGGWSTTYLVAMPLEVPRRGGALLHLVRDDALGWFLPGVLLVALAALSPRAQRPIERPSPEWLAALGAALASTVSMRTLQGGAENTLLPAVAFGAVAVGAVAGAWLRTGGPGARLLVLLALLLQFARLLFSPGSLVPDAAERARAGALVARIQAIEGEVWIPSHTSYAVLAGKPWLVHRDPLLDLQYTGRPHPADLERALRERRFAAVIVDGPFVEPGLEAALEAGYAPAEAIADPPRPLVGYRTRPQTLYRPR